MSRRENPDAMAYVLGELDADATAEFERAMAGDAGLRAQVDQLGAVVGRLERLPAEAWQPADPPPLTVGPPRPRERRRLTLRPAIALACALALLAVGGLAGWLIAGEESPDAPGRSQAVALEPLEGGGNAQGRASLVDGERVTLTVSGLEPTADGSFYELWLLGADNELVGLGSFPVDESGSTTITVPLPVDPSGFLFDVSREPPDGDPGHSGDSVLRGPATGA